jgi:hypothetical protein
MFSDDRDLVEEVTIGYEESLARIQRVFSHEGRYYRVDYSTIGLSREPIFAVDSLNQCECPEVKSVTRTTWEPI